jgi:hypothetical protein
MSLDIAEFVLEIEEAFDTRIPDAMMQKITTPRQLIGYIHSQLPQEQEPRRLSQRAFYVVRRALAERIGLARQQFRPETELLAVLPPENAQEAWAEVGGSLGCRAWPRLPGGWWARTFLSTRPPTLGEAARHVAIFTPSAVKPAGEGWSWAEVATVVRGQICHHFAIGDFSLDDSFVDDLGLG